MDRNVPNVVLHMYQGSLPFEVQHSTLLESVDARILQLNYGVPSQCTKSCCINRIMNGEMLLKEGIGNRLAALIVHTFMLSLSVCITCLVY